MKKHFLKLFTFIIISLCFMPTLVKANEGDLRYEITEVNVSDSKITFKGWAFIHRTNNFNTIEVDGQTILSGGDQKIMMRAVTLDGDEIDYKIVNGSSKHNYNFYCDLFHNFGDSTCDINDYKDYNNINTCENKSVGGNTKSGQCYYEDIYFEIKFDTSAWNYSDVKFQIAASNNNFETRQISKNINNLKEGNYYTNYEFVSVSSAAVSNISNNYIDIYEDSISNQVEFIADSSILWNSVSFNEKFYYYDIDGVKDASSIGTYGAWNDKSIISNTCNNVYSLDLTNGKGKYVSDNSYDFLKNIGTSYYYIKIMKQGKAYGLGLGGWALACPTDSLTDYYTVLATSSHVKIYGGTHFRIKIKQSNKCDVTTPSGGALQCNESKTFNSECDRLTVVTSEGNAEVTIEQTGYISSVLTPLSTHAGGGINFGIMYYNTIRWDYAPGFLKPSYHNLVVEKMNGKLKDYENYINNVNITELKFNDKLTNINMIKSCSTSNNSKDYYSNELVTTCVFSFPLADIHLDGNVSYKSDSLYFNINNKYYTPLNFNGKYSITAKISGMDRIIDSAATSDSKENGKKWTGTWEDTFKNCDINLYTLISGIPKFIYRPIDINNPFPNRNAGINWYDWWSVNDNKSKLKNTYSTDVAYTVKLDNNAITDIKNYNISHNYLEWDSINKETNESSFITEKNYIVRGGN